jgi:hypothetical protein
VSKKNQSEDYSVIESTSSEAEIFDDIELSEQEAAELASELDQELASEKKKNRKALLALVGAAAIVFGLISIAYSLLSSFDTSAVINPVSDKNIHVDVTIVASQFSSGSSSSVCNGSGQLTGISGSTLQVSQSSSHASLKAKLGAGTLTQSGSCLYAVVITPAANFAGGSVSGTVEFPFGNSPATTFDLGTQPPYNHFPITINLS